MSGTRSAWLNMLSANTTAMPQRAGMLLDGADAHRISDHLTNIETVAMGLQGNAARAQAVAEDLVNGFRHRDYARKNDR